MWPFRSFDARGRNIPNNALSRDAFVCAAVHAWNALSVIIRLWSGCSIIVDVDSYVKMNIHPDSYIKIENSKSNGWGSGSASFHFHENARDLWCIVSLFFWMFAKGMIFLSLESSLIAFSANFNRNAARNVTVECRLLKRGNCLLQGREKPNVCMMWEEYMDGNQTDWADSAKSRTRGETWSGVSC